MLSKQITYSNDLKTIVIKNTLYVFNTSPAKQDIWQMDLHTLNEWKKLQIKENRGKDFCHYSVLPFNQPHKPIILFGSLNNNCLQTFILDVSKMDVASCTSIKSGKADRICTN